MSSAAPPSAPVQKQQTHPPNQTLYVSNLNDKIPKIQLRRALYGLFATYGHILDIVALKTSKMRGQAHIVYRDIQTSTQAMRALQGFEFFGKEMRIAYGNGKSNMMSILDGTFKLPDVRPAAVVPDMQNQRFAAPIITNSSLAGSAESIQIHNILPETNGQSARGTKRLREDDESDQEDDRVEGGGNEEETVMDESD